MPPSTRAGGQSRRSYSRIWSLIREGVNKAKECYSQLLTDDAVPAAFVEEDIVDDGRNLRAQDRGNDGAPDPVLATYEISQ